MSAIKDGGYPIVLNGKNFNLLFSLNAMELLQDRFGSFDNLADIFNTENKNMIKDLKWLLTVLFNEGREESEPEYTENQIGRYIHIGNLQYVQDCIFKAFAIGVNDGENIEEIELEEFDDDTDEGNLKSGQE